VGKARNWTEEEKKYLSDNWGSLSMPTLMVKLNRNKNALLIMAQKLDLGPFLESGDYITFEKLLEALGYTGGSSYLTKSWINDRKFPYKNKRVNKNTFRVVDIDDFWKWAEKNLDLLNFS
jgi:hypothetical protein